MTKKLLLKLNMAIVFVVVLFAGVTFGAGITFDYTNEETETRETDVDSFEYYSNEYTVFFNNNNYEIFHQKAGAELDDQPMEIKEGSLINYDENNNAYIEFLYKGRDCVTYISIDASGVGNDWQGISNIKDNNGEEVLRYEMSDLADGYGPNNYALKNGETYRIYLNEDVINKIGSVDVALTFHPLGMDKTNSLLEEPQIPPGVFDVIEKIFSDFVLSIARVLNWIVAMSMGENVTIDTIVFNEYPDAKLEFFKTDIYGSEVETSSSIVASLREPVSVMYSFFRGLAIIGYLIILVYIGIKIMLSSTTAQKKAGYKETFLAWVTGLIILFFMPYFMKYTIALNDAIVTSVKKIPNVDELNSKVTHAPIDTEKGFVYTNFDNAIGDGTDYMSSVYDIANHSGRLGYSIAYLVMSWQVIMLVVYYYKRAFIVALLIIIFPLIAFSYVWDKLNDGKSQALSSWIREYTISVMVQAFHAIVFAFVVATIYSSLLGTTDSRGIANPDFILLIIAAKFLFEGEQILKQIFGGGGEVLGTAAQTGMRIAAVTKLTTGVAGRVIHNTVGKDGLVRTGWRSWQGLRRDSLLLKKMPDGKSVFDMLASSPSRDRRKNELLPSEGDVSPNIDKAAEVFDRLNNMNKNTDEENAEALKTFRELLDARNGKGPNAMTPEEAKQFDAMMKKCNLTKEQLDKINEATLAATASFVALGNNPTKEQTKQILQKLRFEIEAILPQSVDEKGKAYSGKKNAMADIMMEAVLKNIEDGLYTDRNQSEIEANYDKALSDLKRLTDRMHFAENEDFSGDESSTNKNSSTKKKDKAKTNKSKINKSTDERVRNTKRIFESYKKEFGDMTEEQTKVAETVASSLATMEQLLSEDKNKVVTPTMAKNAMSVLENNRDLAMAMMKHSEVKEDIDMLSGALALKMATEDTRVFVGHSKMKNAIDERKSTIVNQYIKQYGTDKKMKEIEEAAENFAFLEFGTLGIDSGTIGKDELEKRAGSIESMDTELVERIKELTMLKDTNEELLNKFNSLPDGNWGEEAVKEWSQSTKEQLEIEAHKRAESFDNGSMYYDDPYATILDIIEAAQRSTDSIHIGSLDDLFANASKPEAREKIINRKKRMSVAEQLKAKEFGEVGLRIEDYEYRRVGDFTSSENTHRANVMQKTRNVASNIKRAVQKNILEEKRDVEQPTFEGYTLDEIRNRRNDEAWSVVNSVLGIASDVAIAPMTTLAGAAIGAAFTDDGMPIEESFVGAMSGLRVGTFASDKMVHKLTGEDRRAEERSEIQKKIKKRINDEQKARLKEQMVAEEADEDARRLDNSLVISGANAYLHIESDGTVSATVNIRASNAEYISVDETPVIPSSGWSAYQESYYYVFKNQNPKADHNLYIYVRDRNGNVKGVRIEGIHL